MNRLLAGVAVLPFLSTVAFAGQPLSDRQMDAVTAGFGSIATAAAQAEGAVITATTATLAEVAVLGSVTVAERTINIIKSVAASSSSSTAVNLPANQALPGM